MSLTGVLGGILGVAGSAAQAAMNWKMAERQMQFQERMSNTAHQREVRDLEAAGLNPILSARLGGSTTPPGASSYVQNPMEAGISGARSAEETRTNVAMRRENVATAQAGRELIEKQGGAADAQAAASASQALVNQAQAQKVMIEAGEVAVRKQLAELTIPQAKIDMELAVSEFGRDMRRAKLGEVGSTAAGVTRFGSWAWPWVSESAKQAWEASKVGAARLPEFNSWLFGEKGAKEAEGRK